jgi:hypothetical protein
MPTKPYSATAFQAALQKHAGASTKGKSRTPGFNTRLDDTIKQLTQKYMSDNSLTDTDLRKAQQWLSSVIDLSEKSSVGGILTEDDLKKATVALFGAR